MAGQKSDLELIAGLKGGGSISGESGKRIQSQIASIMGSINKKPIKIDVTIDDNGSIKRFESSLKTLTQVAKNEAREIQIAYSNAIPPPPNWNGNKGKNPFTELIQYNNMLARTESLLKQVDNAREKWSAANDANSGAQSDYWNLGDYRSRLATLADDMRVQKISLADAQKELSDIVAKFRETSRIISQKDMDFSLEDKTKSIIRAKDMLESMRKNLDKWDAAKDGTAKSSYADYETLYRSLGVLISNFEKGYNGQITTLDAFEERLLRIKELASTAEDAISLANEKHTAAKGYSDTISQLKQVNSLIDQYEKSMRDWSAARTGDTSTDFAGLEKVIADLKTLRDELIRTGKASKDFGADVGKANVAWMKHSSQIKAEGKNYKTIGDRVFGVVEQWTDYIDVMDVVFEAVEYSKRMIESVTNIDTAMTELRKVTNETEATYSSFLENASVRAKELGSTVADVVSSSADFSRLGHDLNAASALADAAIVYQNVGDGINDVETASSSIISTMQAFGIEAENAMSIVDKFNAVGRHNYADLCSNALIIKVAISVKHQRWSRPSKDLGYIQILRMRRDCNTIDSNIGGSATPLSRVKIQSGLTI